MEPEKPVLIVNPRSGGGLDEKRWAQLVGPLTDGLGAFDVRFTEAVGDGRRLAREEAERGRRLVVAFGGDGTISEVVDGLMAAGQNRSELGIIPRGTGGDFRRTLGLPEQIEDAARHLTAATAKVIDVGRVSFLDHDGQPVSRSFVNVARFGFSADVATRANRSGKKLGAKAAFLGATLTHADPLRQHRGADPGGRRPAAATHTAAGSGGQRLLLRRRHEGLPRPAPWTTACWIWWWSATSTKIEVADQDRPPVLGHPPVAEEGERRAGPQDRGVPGRRCGADIPIELDGETPGRLPATFEIRPQALRLRF